MILRAMLIGLLALLLPGLSAQPKQDNILHVARMIDPVTLDPATVQLAEDFELLPLTQLTLLDLTNGTQLIPVAAKDWSASPDRREYVVHLRPEIRFSNGRAVVAEDYRYSLERIINPATAAMFAPYLSGISGAREFSEGKTNHVGGISTPNAETLVIHLEKPDPTFAYLLTAAPGIAVPKEEVERLGPKFREKPVGDGPYRVKDWFRGARLRFERNPNYTGPAPQYLDGIDMMIGGDEFTFLLMFERGELDIANIRQTIPFADLRRIRRDPRWEGLIETIPEFVTMALIMNCEIPPFNNVYVRRAANYAVNRDRWMRVSSGIYSHAEGPLPPPIPGFDPSFRGYEYNPDKAREMMKKSGLPLPVHSVLWHGTEDATRIVAQGAQADLKAVGIDIDLKVVTYGELISAAEVRGKVPFLFSGWGVSIPDPVDMLGTQFDGRAVTNAATMNMAFYSNPEVTDLLIRGAAEVDLPRRYSIYREAERKIVDDAPWVFLGHMNAIALRQPWLKGRLLEPLYPFRMDRVRIER